MGCKPEALDVATGFLADVGNLAIASRRSYACALSAWLRLDGRRRPDAESVVRFAARLRAQGASATTIRYYVRILERALELAGLEARRPRLPRVRVRAKDALEPGQLVELAKNALDLGYPEVVAVAACGLRAGELKVSRAFERKRRSRTWPGRWWMRVAGGKSLEDHDAAALPFLDDVMGEAASMGLAELEAADVYYRVRRSAAGLGLEVHPHLLRHSYATIAGTIVPPTVLMAMLGHRSLRTTMRYIHMGPSAVRRFFES